ncbi:nucleotidyltransferase family protein [uncultured Parabacteroides sp.]|jgi:predicted nucleotidyltransferase|uniref:nucleotidyltransferase family protein n=1 Tax=uncultured Parabacteroides sp. TaxID=512312 RepID=UPI0025E35F1F|nr:nucleotidyltransferase family protein [uncultured Parabacteroides sp.]
MKTTAEYIKLLRMYMQQHASRYGIVRMGIFGSVARQEQKESSDIDIYIEGDLHGFFALSGIKNDLEELLGCSVDLVRLRDKMDDFLKQRIMKEGIYV